MDPHLLIVDDDERIRSLLQQFLVQSDYLVSTAEDAEQARTLLSAIEFDLIILDVMKPGQDGISFTAELRKLQNRLWGKLNAVLGKDKMKAWNAHKKTI